MGGLLVSTPGLEEPYRTILDKKEDLLVALVINFLLAKYINLSWLFELLLGIKLLIYYCAIKQFQSDKISIWITQSSTLIA